MVSEPNPPQSEASLASQYTPLEKRESQNISAKPFVLDYAMILGAIGLGALAGRFGGKALEGKNISVGKVSEYIMGTDKVDRQSGMWLGAKIGGIFGIFQHWKKTEGRQLSVANISQDLRTAMDSDVLKREAQKEQALVSDMQKLQTALSEKPAASHADTVSARREQNSSEHSLN